MNRKKITIKDLRKHIINTKKVDGGKIHTISTPNAGNIEIAEGNKHSKGGVKYIKTSDGITHEIEADEVILNTEKGPYVVSDYMNTDGTKNYNKNKTSYADLVKYLALAGASKQDLERVAMETEIANGNNPDNPTSLIKDTNMMQEPNVDQYQQTNTINTKNHPVVPPTKEQAEKSKGTLKEGRSLIHGRWDRPETLESMRNEWLGRLEYYTNSNIPPKNIKGLGMDPLKVFLDKHLPKNEPLPVETENKMLKEYKYKGGGLVKKYQQITDSQGNMLVPNRRSYPNDNVFQKTGRYIGNKYLQAVGRNDEYYQEPDTKKYQQVDDRQSKKGKDNFFGNLFGPKRTEVNVGGNNVRLDDKNSVIDHTLLNYNITDGDTTGINQQLITSQSDTLNYNITDGGVNIVDKAGNTHNSIASKVMANSPFMLNTKGKLKIADKNKIVTNNTVSEWEYGDVSTTTTDGKITLNDQTTVDSFRGWMNDTYPDFSYNGEPLDAKGSNNKYVEKALELHGTEFSETAKNRFNNSGTTTTTEENIPTEDMNKILKNYKYKGGGLLKRYQEPEVSDEITQQSTNFEGTSTTVESDFLYNYDENLTPITESNSTYGDYPMKDWTHEDDTTPNTQPTEADFHEKGFNNVQEWRDWVNTQPGFEGYDWGNLDFWGPKHDEAWKGMPEPPQIEEDLGEDNTCSGPNPPAECFGSQERVDGSSFSDGGDIKVDKDGKKINWKKLGMLGLGGLAAFGAYKAIAGQMGKTDDMLEAAKGEKPNNIGKQQLGKVDLQRISHRSQIVDSLMRGQSMDNSVEAMNVPEAAKYLLKERNTITTQREVNKIKEAENNINVGISVKEGGLNAQLSMKQADLNTKVDIANQLESRDIRDLKYAAWDRQVAGRQQLISDLIGLGGQGIEAYATLKSKSGPITKGQS